MKTLVIATRNEGKLREFSPLLAPLGFALKSAGALGLPEPEESAPDFAGNARIKALAAARGAGLAALADDSGLSVAALGGAPGVHSAR
ncbi:non-canonical purine NTP pyrophosphatase, partial [Acidocella sp.]